MNDLDPYENCPYDPVHRILRSRMQFHLTRCAKNYPEEAKNKRTCPYDTRHVVNTVEFQFHVSNCPARESVWRYKIDNADDEVRKRLVPIEPSSLINESNEQNWDDEPPVQTYNPLQHIEDKPIVYSLIGASKAKRKAFRKEQRLRYQKITNTLGSAAANTSMQANSNDTVTSEWVLDASDVCEEWEEEDKPLRRPKNVTSENLDISQLSINNKHEAAEQCKKANAWGITTSSAQNCDSHNKIADSQVNIKKKKPDMELYKVPALDNESGKNKTTSSANNCDTLNYTRLTKSTTQKTVEKKSKTVDPNSGNGNSVGKTEKEAISSCNNLDDKNLKHESKKEVDSQAKKSLSTNPWNNTLNFAKAADTKLSNNNSKSQVEKEAFPSFNIEIKPAEIVPSNFSYAKAVDKNLSKNCKVNNSSDVREIIDSSKENILNASILKEELKNVLKDVKDSVEDFDREKKKITKVKEELLRQKRQMEENNGFIKVGRKGSKVAANFKNVK